jgi:hypothetical protein
MACVSLRGQLDRLIELGLPGLAGAGESVLADSIGDLAEETGVVLAVHPSLVPPSRLVTLLDRDGRPGFVVGDMTDVNQFTPVPEIRVPDRPLYLLHDPDRGDHLRNSTPGEAAPTITAAGRSPMTINEGISWLLQEPERLQPIHCFMTIASRKPKGNGLDARTPAIWISGGTGRDGKTNKGAPKVGWCWAGNRHTWLGFATVRARSD